MYWDALKHAMRMSLCDCSVLERVASEKRVDLMEVVGRSNVTVEMKRRGKDRDGSNSLGSVWQVMLESSAHFPVHTVCQ